MRTLPALTTDAVVPSDEAIRVPARSMHELLPPGLDLARIARRERAVFRGLPTLIAAAGIVALVLVGH